MNKKYLVFGFMGMFVMAFAAAALVPYLSNTENKEITTESPFEIDSKIGLDINIQYSGDDDFALVKITNRAERAITADIEFVVSPGSEGIAMAITEDINYCFRDEGESRGDMTGVTDCETDYMTWMENNVEWNDWYATETYSEDVFFSELVINHGEDSFHALGYSENKFILPGMTFPARESVYGVLYVATDPALSPEAYDFDMTIRPSN